MTRLADYKLLRRIGRGGMGSVHQAVHLRLDREVALKVGEPIPDADWQSRFQREIQVLMRLSHPNVVKFLDGGEDDGRLWYAMELVRGPSLWTLIRERGGLPRDEALAILTQVVDALVYLHDQGLLHRDVSSANIMIDADGRAVLTDFGLVRGSESDLTRTGTTVGTPQYLSPEALRGEAVPQSDIWSAGVVAFEMLTGRLPFAEASMGETIMRILTGPTPDLGEAAPQADRPVIDVVERMLERDLARRWRRATDLRAALAGLARGEVPARSAVRSRPPSAPREPRTVAFERAPGRSGARALGAGIVALVLCGLALRPGRAPAPAAPASTASASAATAAPPPPDALPALHLPGARVHPLPEGALFVCRREGPEALAVEVAHGSPLEWRLAATVSDPDPLVVCEVTGLVPDTAYALRVTAAGHAGGLAPYRFRTNRRAGKRAVEDVLGLLRETDPTANPLFADMLSSAPPDRRLAFPLGELLARPNALTDDQVLPIATYAVQAPDRALARRLLAKLSTVQWPLVRARIVHAALAAQLPEATPLVLAELRRGVHDDLLTALPELGVELPPDALERALNGQEAVPGHVRMLAGANRAVRLALADALFRRPAASGARLAGELGHLVPPGPDGDALYDALAREGHAAEVRHALLSAPRPGACRWMDGAAPLERLRAGCEEARAPLEIALRRAPSPGDARAVTLLAAPGSREFLTWALGQAGLHDAAAWALAQARLASELPALRRASGADVDPRGVALWARARLADPEAAEAVEGALAAPAGTSDARTRLALACWAAGELRLASAREQLDALAKDAALPAFVRGCARASAEWVGGAEVPRTYLLLPCQQELATGYAVDALDSFSVWAEVLEEEPAHAPWAFAGAPLWLEPVGAAPARRIARAGGELAIQRSDAPFAAELPPRVGPLLRVSISR